MGWSGFWCHQCFDGQGAWGSLHMDLGRAVNLAIGVEGCLLLIQRSEDQLEFVPNVLCDIQSSPRRRVQNNLHRLVETGNCEKLWNFGFRARFILKQPSERESNSRLGQPDVRRTPKNTLHRWSAVGSVNTEAQCNGTRLLKGSWDLVSRVIVKVTISTFTYNPN